MKIPCSRLVALSLCTALFGACALDGGSTEGDPEGSGGDTDAGSGGSDTDSAQDDVTIYDVQQGMIPEGEIVQLRDVVVTTPVRIDPENSSGAVLVQEPDGGEYSGIYLYLFNEVAAAATLQPGDVISVSGEYTEFYGLSEITVREPTDIEVVMAGGQPPAPAVVSASQIGTGGQLSSAYESVLVTVQNVEVTDAALGFGDFEVDGALIVDDFFFPPLEPNPGTTFESITGVLLYSFEEYRLAPRSEDDAKIGQGGVGAVPATIYQLQDRSRSDAVAEGTKVELRNVVVSTPPTAAGDLFFVQEADGGPFSGIAVFVNDPQTVQIEMGHVITLQGRYEEFYDFSEVVLGGGADITVIDAGSAPAPVVVAAADVATGGPEQEAYEGVLVRVEGVTVTEETNQYGEFVVDDVLIVDDPFFAMGQAPGALVGDTYAGLTGVMMYGFEQAKLAPRMTSDFEP